MKLEIINLRRNIFKYLKNKALNFEGGISIEMKKYRLDQEESAKRDFFPAEIDELKNTVSASNIIYLGDFHTFDQNIRNVLRILKVIINQKNKCVIALEMVDARFQFYIDTYQDGFITDLEFLESINYHDSWRFPWSHYKLIFEMAKENGIKIIGLNTSGTLIERDDFAANLISNTLKMYPESQVLVVYGELHITENKIPLKVSQKNPDIKSVIIHQNLDEVYWKQIEENLNYKIIKFNENEYCINSAPPWIKYESMIYWYENLCDDPDFDIHEYIIENGKKIFGDDTHENFILICIEMIKAIKLDVDQDELEDFNLHDHTNLEFIQEKVYSFKNLSIKDYFQYLIETGQSFKLPDTNTYYCSSYSMNRMAYLAGVHIYHYFLSESEISTLNVLEEESDEKKFMLITFENLFAYFFSKVINPHRKCEMYLDLRNKHSQTNNKQEKAIFKSSINILDGKNLSSELKNLSLIEIHESALFVGHILGEYLYESIFTKTKKIDIVNDFLKVDYTEFSFKRTLNLLLKDTAYKEHLKRYF